MANSTLSLSDLLNELNTKHAALTGMAPAIERSKQIQTDIAGAMQLTTADATGNTAESLETIMQGKLDSQRAVQGFATAAGQYGPASDLVSMGIDLRQALQEATIASSEIDDLESQGGPIAWLQKQFGLHPAYGKYEAAANKFNLVSAGMKAINERIQQVDKTQTDIATSLTDAGKASLLEAQRRQIENANLLAQKAMIVSGEAKLAATMNMTTEDFQRAESLARMKLAMDASNRAEQKLTAAQEKALNEDESWLVTNYKLGYKRTHGTDAPDISGKELMRLVSGPEKTMTQTERQLVKYIQRGKETVGMAPNDARILAYGNDPAEANETLQVLNPEVNPVVRSMYDIFIGPAVNLANSPGTSKELRTPEERKAFVNTQALKKRTELLAHVDHRNTANPFVPPSLAAIVKPAFIESMRDTPSGINRLEGVTKAQPIVNTKLYKVALAPVIKTGGLQQSDPNEVIDLALAAIDKKQITAEQAARDLTDIFAFQVMVNNAYRQFERLGIPEQDTYNATVLLSGPKPVPATLGGAALSAATGVFDAETDIVNLKNINQIKKILMHRTANAVSQKFLSAPSKEK